MQSNGRAFQAPFPVKNRREGTGFWLRLRVSNQPTKLMAMNSPGDQIQIQELELMAQVGVTEEERAQPQRITVSVVLQPRTGFGTLNDELERTIDYAALCAELQRFVARRPTKLIETLAHEMAGHLLRQFDLTKVELELRKFVLPETRYVAARVVRNRMLDGE